MDMNDVTLNIKTRRDEVKDIIAQSKYDDIMHVHVHRSIHLIDNLFSFVMGNMSFVSWIVAGVYMHRICEQPLRLYLIVQGFLIPFAALLPILLR